MAKVFFTYVWGAPGNPCWPLTFGTKAARTIAKKALSEGDFVFTVGTKGELTPETGAALLELERRAVALAEPRTLLGRGLVAQKNSKLAPKHEGEFSGRFGEHDIWYVYALALKDQRGRDLAFKVGYANDPLARLASHNGPMASEITGLSWQLALKQPTSTEDDARVVEQALLAQFAEHKLPSNGEIIAGPSLSAILSAIATIMRPR